MPAHVHPVSIRQDSNGLPVAPIGSSTNHRSWHLPERLFPVLILKAAPGELIPSHIDRANGGEWLFVKDPVDALIIFHSCGGIDRSDCKGGAGNHGRTKEDPEGEVVESFLAQVEVGWWASIIHACLPTGVINGLSLNWHDAFEGRKMFAHLGGKPYSSFEQGLEAMPRLPFDQPDVDRQFCDGAGDMSEPIGKGLTL